MAFNPIWGAADDFRGFLSLHYLGSACWETLPALLTSSPLLQRKMFCFLTGPITGPFLCPFFHFAVLAHFEASNLSVAMLCWSSQPRSRVVMSASLPFPADSPIPVSYSIAVCECLAHVGCLQILGYRSWWCHALSWLSCLGPTWVTGFKTTRIQVRPLTPIRPLLVLWILHRQWRLSWWTRMSCCIFFVYCTLRWSLQVERFVGACDKCRQQTLLLAGFLQPLDIPHVGLDFHSLFATLSGNKLRCWHCGHSNVINNYWMSWRLFLYVSSDCCDWDGTLSTRYSRLFYGLPLYLTGTQRGH